MIIFQIMDNVLYYGHKHPKRVIVDESTQQSLMQDIHIIKKTGNMEKQKWGVSKGGRGGDDTLKNLLRQKLVFPYAHLHKCIIVDIQDVLKIF